jgi:hypothetical protein
MAVRQFLTEAMLFQQPSLHARTNSLHRKMNWVLFYDDVSKMSEARASDDQVNSKVPSFPRTRESRLSTISLVESLDSLVRGNDEMLDIDSN